MAINSVTDLRNTDPTQTPFTVRHNPLGGSTPCHAVQVSQAATSGSGAGLNVVSDNTTGPAIRAKAAGPLIQLYDASNTLKFEVANDGTVTTTGSLSMASLSLSGDASVGDDLAVIGDTTVGGTLTVAGTTTHTGAVTLSGGISGNTTLTGDYTVSGSGKSYRFRTSGGSLDTECGGEDWYWSTFPNADFTGTQNTYMRWESGAAVMHILAEAQFKAEAFGGRVHTLNGSANTLGFHGATPVARQDVTGSRGGNAALASLLTALANVGLITNGTSA